MLVKKIDFFFKWEFDFVFSLDKEYMFTKEKLGGKKKKKEIEKNVAQGPTASIFVCLFWSVSPGFGDRVLM